MDSCPAIEPLLARLADGEAAPDDALRVARHLSDCTACRIRLARERRLAGWLERDMVDLPVSESFVDDVMRSLPHEPPRKRQGGGVRRGLKLASLGALAFAVAWSVLSGDAGGLSVAETAVGLVPPLEAGASSTPLLSDSLRLLGSGAVDWTVSAALLAAAVAAVAAGTALLGASPARLHV